MKEGESLLVCAKAFAPGCESHFANITVKKIPQMILGKCEFGKDNYDLNIIKATEAEAEESNENNMNTKAQAIKNRLSLRKPQADSLEILEKLADVLELKKDVDVVAELAKVKKSISNML